MDDASHVRAMVINIVGHGPAAVVEALESIDWQKELDTRRATCPRVPIQSDRVAWSNLYKSRLMTLAKTAKRTALGHHSVEKRLEAAAVAEKTSLIRAAGIPFCAAFGVAGLSILAGIPFHPLATGAVSGTAFALAAWFLPQPARKAADEWAGHGTAWTNLYTAIYRARVEWRANAHAPLYPQYPVSQARLVRTLAPIEIAHDLLEKHSHPLPREDLEVAAATLARQWDAEDDEKSEF